MQCYKPVLSSSITLPTRPNPLNLFITSTVIWFRSCLNGLLVFPTFFNFSLNFSVRSLWTEPQSVPDLVFMDCIELLHLWLQRTWSIWFQHWPSGEIHVYSHLLGCWKRVFVVTHMFSWQNSVSPCRFFLYSRVTLAYYSGYLLTSYFCIPIPCGEKDMLFLVLILEGVVGPHKTSQLQLNCCAIHLKLTHYCKSTILQWDIFFI